MTRRLRVKIILLFYDSSLIDHSLVITNFWRLKWNFPCQFVDQWFQYDGNSLRATHEHVTDHKLPMYAVMFGEPKYLADLSDIQNVHVSVDLR